MKRYASAFLLLALFHTAAHAQVKIGNNPTTINTNSILELETTNKGLVLPRIALTNVTSPSPLSATVLEGTFVYNTNASVAGGSGAGLYYWTGSQWQYMVTPTSANAWLLTGNSVVSSSTNFLGTTSLVSVRFRTNNVQRMIIDSLGRIGIGLNNPLYALSVLSASNPLYLSGVQATSTFSADSVLTINNGIVKKSPSSALSNIYWSTTGNAGTGSSNFLGTTDNVPLIIKVNNTQSGYFDAKNNIIFSQNSPASLTGNYNFGIGSQVFSSANSGSNNVAVGTNALATNSGNYNLSVGSSSMLSNKGSWNFALGDQALAANGNGANYNVAIGSKAMNGANGGSNNFAFGANALNTNTGNFNVAIGNSALYSNVGSYNFALGDQALYSVPQGGANYNVAIGSKAMNGASTGSNNLALGTSSLNTNSGNYNVSVGDNAMNTNQGSYNLAVGSKALYSNAFGSNYNLAMGYQAMSVSNTGSNNLAFGSSALNTNTGSNNLGFGNQALLVNQGNYNFAFGYNVMLANTSGDYNFAFGSNTLNTNTTGSNNIAIGSNALDANTTGSNNIGIGQNTDVLSGTLSNAIAIGNNAKVGLSNSLVLGDTTFGGKAVNVGIGVRNPLKRLHIDAAPISNSNLKDSLKIDNLASSASAANKAILVRDSITGYVSNQSIATLAGGNFWGVNGNSGTNTPANFLGTTDNASLAFRTNNVQRMYIDSATGNVGIGLSVFDPINPSKLSVFYGPTTSHTIANFRGSNVEYLQMNLQNTSNSNNASTDYVATADNGTDSTYYVDFGINSSTYAPSIENFGGPNDGYLYANARNLLIGTQAVGSDLIFMVAGNTILNNTAMRISGSTGNIILGRGEGTNSPLGNVMRGPNANGTGNSSGGTVTLQGGRGNGTGNGGSINIIGGATGTGTVGSVNINASAAFPTNINTGTSSQNLTMGGNANNILLPKFSTVGGLYYTSLSTGQLANTGANMTWDSINNRLGIGVASPAYKLHVVAASNPLYLAGVQTTSSFSSDSILTILNGVVKKAPYSALPSGGGSSSGWALTGNSGTNTGSNFIGTTDGNGLVFKVNNTQAGYLGISGSSYATSFGVSSNAAYQATAIGSGAQATQNASVALGYNSSTSAQDAISIGDASNSNSNEAIAIGHNAAATSYQAIALGTAAKAQNNNQTIAIGSPATASSYQAIAIGYGATASNNNSALAIGVNSKSSGYQSTALGSNTNASGQNSAAIGNGASATQDNTVILGTSNTTVGIGTSTPNSNSKLDVNGSFELGSKGNLIKNMFAFNSNISINMIGNTSSQDIYIDLPGGASITSSQATVSISPSADMDGIAIAFARMNSSTQIKVRVIKTTNGTQSYFGNMNFSIVEF